MAQAITYSEFGGPEVLTLTDVEVPAPGEGQVGVRIEAAGVNPIDHKLRSGFRPSAPPDKPRRIGNDAAGIVTAVGDGVDGYRLGDPVVIYGASGMYATDVVVGVEKVQHRPPQVSAAEGAAIGVPASTAYQSLRSLDVRDDDTLLIHAGSGAVGQAAIQFAVLWGATVVATASPRRFDRVRELGATPVAYGEGLVDRVRQAAPRGVTVIFDAAGTDEALDASVELLEDRSRIGTIVRGRDAEGVGIRAFSGGSPQPLTPAQQTWRAEAIPVTLSLLSAGSFSIELGREFSLTEAAEAHRAIEAGADGKITLVP